MVPLTYVLSVVPIFFRLFHTNTANKPTRFVSAPLICMCTTVRLVAVITFGWFKPTIRTQKIPTNDLSHFLYLYTNTTFLTPWDTEVASSAFNQRILLLPLACLSWAIKNQSHFITLGAEFYIEWTVGFSKSWKALMAVK